jgi:hypothetical protein
MNLLKPSRSTSFLRTYKREDCRNFVCSPHERPEARTLCGRYPVGRLVRCQRPSRSEYVKDWQDNSPRFPTMRGVDNLPYMLSGRTRQISLTGVEHCATTRQDLWLKRTKAPLPYARTGYRSIRPQKRITITVKHASIHHTIWEASRSRYLSDMSALTGVTTVSLSESRILQFV